MHSELWVMVRTDHESTTIPLGHCAYCAHHSVDAKMIYPASIILQPIQLFEIKIQFTLLYA